MALIEFDISPKDETLDILRKGARGCLAQMKASVENAISIVWQNPHGLTPQEVFDVLDTQGKTLVNFLTTLRTTYNGIAPTAHDIGALTPAGKTVSFDGEGRGTVEDI